MNASPVAIVTGAGSGIGRSACGQLAAAGYRLVLVGRTKSALEETMAEVSASLAEAPSMLIVAADVSDAAQARGVVERTMEQWGRVDALVNNAGVAILAPLEETDEALLDRTFAVNVFGPAHLIAAVFPIYRRLGGGCVVNVSSMAAADPFPGFFVYAASKSAIESMTRSIMKEGGEHGIRAFSVAPGAVETGMLRALFTEKDLPPDATMSPAKVARVICDCIAGRRAGDVGTTIAVPNS